MLLLSARKEKLGEKESIWYHQEKENGSNTISGHSRTPKLPCYVAQFGKRFSIQRTKMVKMSWQQR
jgi:hypothetical protein